MNKRIKFIFFLMACLMPLAMVAQQTHWTPQGSAYEDNMTLTGVIQINGVEQQSAALEVGAFCGTECRGAVRAVLFPATQRYVVMLTIFGNNGDQITFKLYDHNQGMELNYQSPSAVTFGSNGLGTLMNPYVLNFTSPEYTISASASPSNGGTISGAGTYPGGSTCTLTATPATGYSFVRWTKNGSQVSTNPSYSFTVTGNASYVAVFSLNSYTISVSANPSEGGTVSGGGTYNYGSSCTLTATPATGYSFVRWTKNGSQVSTNPSYSFTVTGNASYVAVFSLNSYTISVSANPSAGGTVSGGGTYDYGSSCTLTATSATGYSFVNWTENGEVASTEATYSFTVTRDKNLVANFIEAGSGCSITFNLNDSFGDGWTGNYLVVSYGDISEQLTIENGSTASYNLEIPDGSNVELTWISGSWIGECSYTISYENGNVIYYGSNMNSNFSYGFDVDCVGMPATLYDIIATTIPVNGGTVMGAGGFEYGSTCTLTATSNEDFIFLNWTENGTQVSKNPIYEFIVTENRTLEANFISIASLLYVLSDDFNDGEINSSYWTATGPNIFEEEGMIKIQQNVTDNYVALESVPMSVPLNNQIVIDREFLIHDQYHNSAWGDRYFYGNINIKINGSDDNYVGLWYYDDDYENRHGTYLRVQLNGEVNETRICDARFDAWIKEKIILDISDESLSYYLNDTLVSLLNVPNIASQQMDYYTVRFKPDGWWTGHYHNMDYVNINVLASLSDNFNDSVIDTTLWTYQGSTVYEDEGLMKIEQNVTDNDVRLTTLPMLLTTSGQIVMERSFKVHRANNYFSGGFAINFNGVGDEESNIRISYWDENYIHKYGTYVDASIDGEVTEIKLCDAIFDTWLTEKVIVDTETGRLIYYLNNELVAVVPINGLASKEVSYYTIKFWPYGWWTGHYHYMDYVNVNVNQDDLLGVFSVSENNQVNFSQGNLQYQASTNTWRFAEHQWDYMGGDNANISETNSGWIDLFGWGTSGYNHGAGCYQPWSTSETYSDYYAYGDETYNLCDQTGQADWGYNAISNGGNITNIWRTLTREEWSYVFHTRNTPSGIRYAMAQVNNVNGIILLPDDWSSSYYSLNNTNNGASFATNVISSSDWMNSLQAHGAVFLPAAGHRNGASNINSVGSFGYYWSASRQDSRYALLVEFWEGESWPVHVNAYSGSTGLSVRLVRPSGYYFFSINATPSSTEGGTIEGAGTYEACSTCTLTATPNEGYNFVHWTENGEVVSTEATYSFMVTGNRNLVAFFSPPLNITAEATPSEGGTVSFNTDFENQQIPSSWTNDATYPWVVTTPEYSGYNGSFCMMSGNGGVHSSTSSIEVTVDFIQDGSISFIAGCWGEGSYWDLCKFFIDDNQQFSYGAQQSWNSYYYEVPVGTHTFRWSYSKDNSVHPTGDAFFVDDVKFMGVGIGSQFNYGQTCALTATPNEGYLFLNWNRNGEVLSCDSNYSFTVTEPITLEAVFMPLNGRLVGSGEATNQYLPSYSYYCYTLSQQIYTPDEIGAAGSILTLSYFNAGETKTRSYDIYMVHTDKNTFENNTDWITVTEADRVFSGEVTMTRGYWNTILLDVPFDYDGTSNLAIIVDDNSGSWSSNHMYCRVFNANGNQAIRVYSDGTNYDPYNPSGYGGTLHSVKNQMIFGVMPAYHFVTAGTWGNAANWSGGALPGAGDAVFIDANCALNRDAEVAMLSVTPGQVLTLRPGKTLSVTGNLFNTAIEGLVVEDGAQLVSTSYNVAATVKKNVQAYNNSNPDGWYTISSPTNGMVIEGSNFLTPGYDLYRFNETNLTHDEWENYKVNLADFTIFEKGRGYLYANSNTFAPAFTGLLNNLDVTYTLTCTERPNDPLSGFNLIGNPFPHEIYKGAGGAINNVNLASGYYTLTNEGTWEVHSFDDAIQPGQGFLVKATAPTVLTIAKSNEVAFSESGDAKKGVTERMCISIAGDNGQDRTYVYFGQGVGLDKKNDFDAQVPNLWIRDNGHDYAIAHVEDTDESLELCFSNRKEGDFTLAITTSDTEFEYLQLIDRVTGVTVDLMKQSVYTFHSDRNEGTKRFTLAFKKK